MTTEIPRTMGRGLTRLESYLPSTRGETVFGEMRRMLDRAPQEQRDAQRLLDQGARAGATVGGVLAQHVNERGRSRWGRMFGVSATRRAEEAELVELLGVVGGVVGGGIARAKVHYDERRRREEVGRLVWQAVSLAATADGPVNAYNEALRWRVLDALDLTAAARARLAAAPLPTSYQALTVPPLQDGARDAVATYAFHAHANAAGEEAAARRIVPLLVRLGMSRSGGEHFAHRARAEYRSELDLLSHHYRMLQFAVIGVGHRLFLPLDVIAEAAGRVVRFDPYEAARAENLRVLAQVVRASAGVGAMALTGNVAPAMSIAAGLAEQLFGAAADGPAARGALAAVGADAGLPQAAVQTWLAWNNQDGQGSQGSQ
jgi:NTP pyrophosphatase (non-canonical NTP hydrolase)